MRVGRPLECGADVLVVVGALPEELRGDERGPARVTSPATAEK
jgi:hypothetical protein